MKTALFPGSFDPITSCHENLILQALSLFDRIIIGIGINPNKKYSLSLEKRLFLIEKAFVSYPQVKVAIYEGLTVDFCREENIKFIIRGVRNIDDFQYEKTIADINKAIGNINTVFFVCDSTLSTSLVGKVNKHNKNIFIPSAL
jgi:pantetheine-phosphate adenylyltransferase